MHRRPAPERAAVFGLGAGGYCLLELLWRGRTHWTMALAGGACFSLLYALQEKLACRPLWLRALAGAAGITAVEFAAGCVVNRRLHWAVWDYSARRANLLGQVCALFSCLWFLLCLAAFPLCAALQQRFRPARPERRR